MKRLWILISLVSLLVGCVEENGPVQDGENTGVDCTAPSPVHAGEDAVIQWDGFKDGDRLCLSAAAGQDYDLEVKTISSSGLIFHIPVSVPAGDYMLVLVREERIELGQIAVLEAKIPVSGVVMPDEATAGEDVAVAGLGFEAGCVITLVDDAEERHVMETALADDGITFSIPEDWAEGTYKVYLEQDGMTWFLSSMTVTKKQVIKSLKSLRKYTPYIGDAEQMHEWKLISSEPMEITFSHYLIQEDGPALNEYDGYVFRDSYSLDLEYDEMEISNNEMMDFIIDADGNVESADVLRYGKSATTPYIWTYKDSQLISIDLPGGSLISISYTDGNLTTFDLTGFKYEDASLKNHPYAWNVAWAYASFGYENNGEVAPFVPYFLGWYRPSSPVLPSAMVLPLAAGTGTEECQLSYEFDEDGYVTLMSWEGAENVGRLEFIY